MTAALSTRAGRQAGARAARRSSTLRALPSLAGALLALASAPAAQRCDPRPPGVGRMLIEDYSVLPADGPAWREVLEEAQKPAPAIDVFDISNVHDVWTLANAFAWKRSGADGPRLSAVAGIQAFYTQVCATEDFGKKSIIGACRNTLAYVISADLLMSDTADPPALTDVDRDSFVQAVTLLHDVTSWSKSASSGCQARTLAGCHDLRPNNHGTYCGGASVAIEWFLTREAGTEEQRAEHEAHLCARRDTFRGFLGDVDAYDGFVFGDDLSWHERGKPLRPIARRGARVGERLVDGCIADDMRRVGDGPATPEVRGQETGTDPDGCDDDEVDPCPDCGLETGVPGEQGRNAGHCRSIECFERYRDATGAPVSKTANRTGYPWEAMQGLVMQAQLLSRAGWPAFEWESRAVERATRFLYVEFGHWAQDSRSGVVCQSGGESVAADDTWVPWIVEAHCDSDFLQPAFWSSGAKPLELGPRPGKNFGFAEWWSAGIRAR